MVGESVALAKAKHAFLLRKSTESDNGSYVHLITRHHASCAGRPGASSSGTRPASRPQNPCPGSSRASGGTNGLPQAPRPGRPGSRPRSARFGLPNLPQNCTALGRIAPICTIPPRSAPDCTIPPRFAPGCTPATRTAQRWAELHASAPWSQVKISQAVRARTCSTGGHVHPADT